MEIEFSSRKLANACNSERESVRTWGPESAKRVRRRLFELAAADTLADMSSYPPARCHPLKGDRAGAFAVDLQQPHRLLFEPRDNPIPKKEDGSIDLTRITAIRILEVVNYHDD